eukprot:ctg_4121.g512
MLIPGALDVNWWRHVQVEWRSGELARGNFGAVYVGGGRVGAVVVGGGAARELEAARSVGGVAAAALGHVSGQRAGVQSGCAARAAGRVCADGAGVAERGQRRDVGGLPVVASVLGVVGSDRRQRCRRPSRYLRPDVRSAGDVPVAVSSGPFRCVLGGPHWPAGAAAGAAQRDAFARVRHPAALQVPVGRDPLGVRRRRARRSAAECAQRQCPGRGSAAAATVIAGAGCCSAARAVGDAARTAALSRQRRASAATL